MNRFVIPIGAFGLLALVLAVGVKHSPEKGLIVSPFIGKPAPQFALPDLTDANRTISASELKGRWYVFNVWGTWCYACRIEHPMLLEAQKQGVAPIIGLDWKDDDGEARAYLNQLGNPFAVVAADRDGRTAINYGVYGAPETFLVDPRGVIVFKHVGPLTREIWQKEFVTRIEGKAGKS
jgi:cytochrome c biogenesis protein CcmG/thiol:disulfide interchange protein DsbE